MKRMAVLGLVLFAGAPAAADPPAMPGILKGFSILDTYRDPAMHHFGDPDDFIKAAKPLRLRLQGAGDCKVTVSVLGKDDKPIASETQTVSLPGTFTAKFKIPSFSFQHQWYNVRAIRVAPVMGPCVGSTYTSKISVAGSAAYSVLAPTKPIATKPLRIAYDGRPDNNTLKLNVEPHLGGTHEGCRFEATVTGGGIKKTFKTPPLALSKWVEVPDVDKALGGVPSGNYVLVLKADDDNCEGSTLGPLTITVVKPGLKRATPRDYHIASGKQQAITVESSFPNVRCDLDYRLYTRPIDHNPYTPPPPVIRRVTVKDVAMPHTIESNVFKGDFPTILGDTLTHVVVTASGPCEGEVMTDFGTMVVPKDGVTVVTALPTIQGLRQQYSKGSEIKYQVKPPPEYTSAGLACCQIETYRLDEANGWVRFKQLTGALTMTDVNTMYAADKKPTLVRFRGYRNGHFVYWSDPTVITWP
jgi:hypothetical protein